MAQPFACYGFSLDVAASYNTYMSVLSQLRIGANYADPEGLLSGGLNWYKYTNPYYKDPYFSRNQVQIVGGLRVPPLNIEARGDGISQPARPNASTITSRRF